jgi:hypothetical protein
MPSGDLGCDFANSADGQPNHFENPRLSGVVGRMSSRSAVGERSPARYRGSKGCYRAIITRM